jgi:hypothetical protein
MLDSLKAELARSELPLTCRDYERLAIRFQVASEAMQEAAEQLRY